MIQRFLAILLPAEYDVPMTWRELTLGGIVFTVICGAVLALLVGVWLPLLRRWRRRK